MVQNSQAVTWRQFEGDGGEWDSILASLNCGSFHQCFAWGEYRRIGGWRPIRMIAIDQAGTPRALTQVLTRCQYGIVVAWLPGGPTGNLEYWNQEFRRSLLDLLCTSFLYCRLNFTREVLDGENELMGKLGWRRPYNNITSGFSMEYELTNNEQERLGRLSSNWRHNLKRSQKYDIRIETWENCDPKEIHNVYQEMGKLKGLDEQFSATELEALVSQLGKRLILYRCLTEEGRLVALRGAGLFGKQSWDLLAATTSSARKVYASYALFWAVAKACRQKGARSYDLGGVDPERNKGVYNFKQGTGSRLIRYLGEWDWASVPMLRYFVNKAMRYRGIVG